MQKFLYVFSEEDKNWLLQLGYKLFKEDERGEQPIYVFYNKETLLFALDEVDHMFSDVLTF